MTAITTEQDGPQQPGYALALGTHQVGGSISANHIDGRLLLLSDLPMEMTAPLRIGYGMTGIGGGADLTIRGNQITRLLSRYENTEPTLSAFNALVVTDNVFAQTHNSLLAASVTLGNNQFKTRSPTDVVGIAAARNMTITGNQAMDPNAALTIMVFDYREAANLLRIQRASFSYYYAVGYPAGGWIFAEGIGADLL